MNLYFMLAFSRSKEPNPVLVELFDRLRAQGFHVEIGIGSELLLEHAQPVREHDLYILKSHSPLWLSLAGTVHVQGGRLLNPYLPCLLAHNKIVATRCLEAAKIPIPRSWVTGDLYLLRAVSEERPVVLKPYMGGRGVGVALVRNPQELSAVPAPQEPVLIQEYVPGDELKVYVIGEEVFGVRKVQTSAGPVRVPSPVSAEVRAIALGCGALFGLNLYGLDVIEGPNGPVVIDLNYFPSYKGVPHAAELLADRIVAYTTALQPAPRREGPMDRDDMVLPTLARSAANWT